MQAFEGIKVLDLTHVLAGPFSTYQLAALGADVLKVEDPENPDMNREIGIFSELNEAQMGAQFISQAGNKRAMTLNLKSDEGREIFLALARDADVIVENFRAGAMERLQLGYEDIRAINPTIIYCSITGFGQTGPKRGHAAFDNVIQAWSGMVMATGTEAAAVPVGPPVLDYGTGAQAAFAIASALFRRSRTGEGQHLDVAMLDAALMLMTCYVSNTLACGQDPKRSGFGGDFLAGYGFYETADGLLALGVATPSQHQRMWRALGREDLAQEVTSYRMRDIPQRCTHDAPILRQIFAGKSADEWEAILNEAGVPAGRVRTLGEALASDQVASRAVLGKEVHADVPNAAYRPAVSAFTATQDGPAVDRPPPGLGEHTEDVLRGLGYSADQVDALKRQKVV
ncbi:MAG: CaiB/BaiF CoA-transferase family protein [Pseudomonadota bacterium]